MTRFTLPNLNLVFALLLSGAILSTTAHADLKSKRMRVDCRFFVGSSNFCYSSALYKVYSNYDIGDIRFGTGCNYETIYDDGATTEPQNELGDSIRPRTAALPRLEVTPKGALRRSGTYTSRLETDQGRLPDGTCYVREVDDEESDYQLLMQNWFYFQ